MKGDAVGDRAASHACEVFRPTQDGFDIEQAQANGFAGAAFDALRIGNAAAEHLVAAA